MNINTGYKYANKQKKVKIVKLFKKKNKYSNLSILNKIFIFFF
jgi:hypothetical protein